MEAHRQTVLLMTILPTNTTPVASAGSDQAVTSGSTVSLSGAQSSDEDGDTLSYTWSFSSVPSGSSASLSSTSSSETTFVADIDGSYVASLVVNDGSVDSSAYSISVVASTESSTSSSGSVTQGLATTTIDNLFESGSRIAAVGTIIDEDSNSWTVPAEVRYQDDAMPCHAMPCRW